MKFISFLHNKEAKYGVINDNLITDLTGKVLDAKTLKELIQKKGISNAKKYASENPGNIKLDQIEYLPLIPNPGKIICVGLNYSEHVKETKNSGRIQHISPFSRKSNCSPTTYTKTYRISKSRL